MIAAGLLLAHAHAVLAKAASASQRALPVEGALAADSPVQSPRRTAATVGALMLSVSMVVAFGGSSTPSTSVDEWLDNVLNPDFLVSASANPTARRMTFPAGRAPSSRPSMAWTSAAHTEREGARPAAARHGWRSKRKIAGVTRRSMIAGNEREMQADRRRSGMFVSGAFATNNHLRLRRRRSPDAGGNARAHRRRRPRLPDMGFAVHRSCRPARKDDAVNTARVYVKKGRMSPRSERVVGALAGHG
jgi:hypothetical protein